MPCERLAGVFLDLEKCRTNVHLVWNCYKIFRKSSLSSVSEQFWLCVNRGFALRLNSERSRIFEIVYLAVSNQANSCTTPPSVRANYWETLECFLLILVASYPSFRVYSVVWRGNRKQVFSISIDNSWWPTDKIVRVANDQWRRTRCAFHEALAMDNLADPCKSPRVAPQSLFTRHDCWV